MAASRPDPIASVDELEAFDALIDTRSPSEFAEDHIPGAINLPVLDDAQRTQVGTVYAQESPFAARRIGAALVARNIALHIEERLAHQPKQWKPLVYCWRGGQRSGAMTLVLGQIGWAARQLEGGYRAYRRRVIADLEQWPARYRFTVLHGPTGSGKTALLEALAAAGGQVLDLEGLARHRGSVLGGSILGDIPPAAPDAGEAAPASPGPAPQPGQRAFETGIWDALRGFDARRPVFVESESRRIGRLSVPSALFEVLVDSQCLRIAAPLQARVDHLLDRYADIYEHPEALKRRLDFFVPLHGRKCVSQWRAWVDDARWGELAQAMVCAHYDPAYRRGGDALYRRAGEAQVLELERLDRDAIIRAAHAILHSSGTGNAD